jgi:hypothetical protein
MPPEIIPAEGNVETYREFSVKREIAAAKRRTSGFCR